MQRSHHSRSLAGLRVAALAVLLAAGLASSGTARAEAPAPTVIVLSWDGVRHDYPERAHFPGLARLEREGARAEALVPVFPSNTFPNHVSLATGAPVDRHGIVDNRFFDPERGMFDYSNDASFLAAEPLWAAAERQGVRAAVFFWVGSETDWEGVGATHRRAPFDSGIGEAEKVDQLLAWLDLPAPERPRLLMSWWHGADHVGHRYGPDSEHIVEALAGQDAELVRLLAGLDAREAWSHTTLLLVSDHGMTHVDDGLDLRVPLRERGIEARVNQAGATARIHLADPERRDAAMRALNALDGVTAYPHDAVPQRLRYRFPGRLGDVVALARAPLRFGRPSRPQELLARVARFFTGARGGHGYDPQHPDMAAVLFALGRGVPEGARLGRVHALQVAASVSRLLGIAPPRDAEGAPIEGLGRTRRAPETGRPRADGRGRGDSAVPRTHGGAPGRSDGGTRLFPVAAGE